MAMTMKARISTSPLEGHSNIGLQFSGGKDSLAVVYLLKQFWDRLVLYHVDTGDLLPEVREIVRMVEERVPRFVRIETHAREWTERFALPSDLVPTTCTPLGQMIGQGSRRIIDRYDCCIHNNMAPMHARMLADGVTLVIRGTKRSDMAKLPAENGDTGAGYGLWLPIVDWSDDEVFAYLREEGLPVCRVYEHRMQSPECATCPAWWSEGRASYLKKYHPDLLAIYKRRLNEVTREIIPLFGALKLEHEAIHD